MKRLIESTWGERFLKLYNVQHSTSFRITSQPNPPEPDLKCEDPGSGDVLFLEITELWENDADAKDLYDLVRGIVTEDEQLHRKLAEDARKDPYDAYFNRLMDRIYEKCSCRYVASGPIILVIGDKSPFSSVTEVQEEILSNIRIPDEHPFAGISLVLLEPSTYGEYRLLQIV
ncbi:MAG: hypothetical protein GYA46_12975 [candidate division Zixibacteria bacterium]|nr:hypothetical protein [candidate division Zixibacteria bacterium]